MGRKSAECMQAIAPKTSQENEEIDRMDKNFVFFARSRKLSELS